MFSKGSKQLRGCALLAAGGTEVCSRMTDTLRLMMPVRQAHMAAFSSDMYRLYRGWTAQSSRTTSSSSAQANRSAEIPVCGTSQCFPR